MDMKRWLVWAAALLFAGFGYAFIASLGFMDVVIAGFPMALMSALIMWFCISADPEEISMPHWVPWTGIMGILSLLIGWLMLGSPFELFSIWYFDVALLSALVWYYVAPRFEHMLHI